MGMLIVAELGEVNGKVLLVVQGSRLAQSHRQKCESVELQPIEFMF